MHPFLEQTFSELDRAGIVYCLLRDADRLEALDQGGEVDLLVQGSQWSSLRQALHALGYVPVPMPGYAPHHFFIAYDPATDCWFKLDVVTSVAFGRPVKYLETNLAHSCLEHRRRVSGTYAPAPEEEFMALLLHCVLDKGFFAPHRQARLSALRHEIASTERMDEHLRRYWLPDASWATLTQQIDTGDWDAILAAKKRVAAHLGRRQPVASRTRRPLRKIQRSLGRITGLLRPAMPSVALLGPDGAGKSTLAHGLTDHFCMPVRSIYMGLYQKKNGERQTARRIPGFGFVRLLLTQWGRYLKARQAQARGHLVVFDRYPYDALLPSPRRRNPLKRARRWLLARACPPPNLVLVLDAPAEQLYARKGEHSVEVLETQRLSYRALQQRLPAVTILDATSPPAQVRRQANTTLWRILSSRKNGSTP